MDVNQTDATKIATDVIDESTDVHYLAHADSADEDEADTNRLSGNRLQAPASVGHFLSSAKDHTNLVDIPSSTATTGFEIKACPSVQERLKSPWASCFHFSLARQTGTVLCCLFHVKSTHARCLRPSVARWTSATTASGKFCKRENLV